MKEERIFKELGKSFKQHLKYQMTSQEKLDKALDCIKINGEFRQNVDRKRIPKAYYHLLVKEGYLKDLPNINVCILTDKVFSESTDEQV